MGGELSILNAGAGFALSRAFVHFQAAILQPAPEALHPGIRSAVALIRESADRPSLAVLARRAGLSEAHLSKLFSSQIGISVTEFRNRVGVDRFLAIYGQGDCVSLMEAAMEAGFGSYPQFHRVFRRYAGCSPAEHRRRGGRARASTRANISWFEEPGKTRR